MKMYVVLRNFDNGEAYEDHCCERDVFVGVFSTKDLAEGLAKERAERALNELCDDDSCRWYVFSISNVTLSDNGMRVDFDAYSGHGYIEYVVIETELDKKWDGCLPKVEYVPYEEE